MLSKLQSCQDCRIVLINRTISKSKESGKAKKVDENK